MASSSTPVHPYRYLALFLALLIGLYMLVFLTGNREAKPKLGIDLQGGTRVTLTARTPDGSKPTRDALDQALQIISSRVNGLGVSGSEVVIDGDNLVITVPGNDGNEARNLGQTARLFVRPVIGQPIPVDAVKKPAPGTPGAVAPGSPPAGNPGAPPGGVPGAPPGGVPGAPPGGVPGAPPGAAPVLPAPASPAPQPRPFPLEPTPTPPVPPGQPTPPSAPGATAPLPGPPDPRKDLAARIKFEKELRQSDNQNLLLISVQYMAGRCDQEDVLAGNDDPNLPLVTCSQDQKYVYILDK